ncbi:hypothetical protein N7540_003346 [Penicillium herquei]|nr:hypothetical protein N7540_003346 [Penicillium herquei]
MNATNPAATTVTKSIHISIAEIVRETHIWIVDPHPSPREITLIGEYDPEAPPFDQAAALTPGPVIAAVTSGEDERPQNDDMISVNRTAVATSGPFSRFWRALPSLRWLRESTNICLSALSSVPSEIHLDNFASSDPMISNSTEQAASETPLVGNPSCAKLARTTIIPSSENCDDSCQIRLVSFPRGTNPRPLEQTVHVKSGQDDTIMTKLAEGIAKTWS